MACERCERLTTVVKRAKELLDCWGARGYGRCVAGDHCPPCLVATDIAVLLAKPKPAQAEDPKPDA